MSTSLLGVTNNLTSPSLKLCKKIKHEMASNYIPVTDTQTAILIVLDVPLPAGETLLSPIVGILPLFLFFVLPSTRPSSSVPSVKNAPACPPLRLARFLNAAMRLSSESSAFWWKYEIFSPSVIVLSRRTMFGCGRLCRRLL